MSGSAVSLYDEPGPRARRRIRVASAVTALLILALIIGALLQLASHGQLDADRWSPFLQLAIWQYLLVGFAGTLQAAALTAVLGAALGVLLALGRLSRLAPVRIVCTVWIEVARTVPALLLIYLTLFGLPQLGLDLPLLWKLVVPLTATNSAAFAEIVRAGILGLPRGQAEAALSLGMRRTQVDRLVVLPQAFRAMSPSLIVQLVSVVKDTSLGYVVAFTELLYRGQVLSAYNHLLIQTFVAVTVIYLVFNGLLSALASRLQRRSGPRRVSPPTRPLVAVPVLDEVAR